MVALVHGAATSIGRAVISGLTQQNVLIVSDECAAIEDEQLVSKAIELHQRLDYVFNCVAPTSETYPTHLLDYPQKLMLRNSAACQAMVACKSQGAIVNQFFLGSLHAGTALEAPILMGKGAITGLTRQLCCQFGKAGIRINTVQAGLVDLPENQGLVTAQTLARKPPVGRWGTPAEIAKFMLFLALRNGYMTGQAICFDGGLTAGNTGT